MITFGEASKKLGWKLRGVNSEWVVGPPAFDSRQIEAGQLFFGLKGETDGGKFAYDALKKGAQAVVVSQKWAQKLPSDAPVITVNDTLNALKGIASLIRKQFKGKVLGITGSCGKTTVKEIIHCVLSKKFRVLKSPASFNNHIGVPYTIARLSNEFDIALIEVGANHPGEINDLCQIARPTAGLITMVGKAHLQGFKDLRGVAKAKGELFRNLTGAKTAFVNFDDPYVVGQSSGMQIRIGYGFAFPPAGQGFARIYQGTKRRGGFSTIEAEFQFPFPEFMQIHSLAAVAIAHFWGVETFNIQEALKCFGGIKGRMQRIRHRNAVIYDDTYNSNPSSLAAALKFIASLPGERKIAVLGDMLELGYFSTEEHKRALELARKLKFERVITVGEEFAAAGSKENYETAEKAAATLKNILPLADIALFKGSRAMHIERILQQLIPEFERD